MPQRPPVPLPQPWEVENHRRSVVMLPPGVWALRREEAARLLEQLAAALEEIRRLQA
jgi:hypothetical protein